MIAVIPHLGGKVEGHAEPGLSLLQQVLVALVGVLRAAEPRVLAHGPEPPPVHGGLDPARVRIVSGESELFDVRFLVSIQRGVHPLQGEP
jgi:hypothetical protein